jgi:hypothetical protein
MRLKTNWRQQVTPEDSVDVASLLAGQSPTPEPPKAPAADVLGHPKEREEEVQYQAPVSRGNGMQDYGEYAKPRSGQMRLSPAEVEVARFSGLSVQEYAVQKAKFLQARQLDPQRYGTKG